VTVEPDRAVAVAVADQQPSRWAGLARTGAGFTAWWRLELSAAVMFRLQLMLGLFGWVVPLAFMALWNTAAEQTDGTVMTAGQTTTYYLSLLVTSNLAVMFPIIFGFGERIYSGELSVLLLQPLHPFFALMARPLASGLFRFAPLVVVLPLLAVGLGASSTAGPGDWAAGVGLWLLGWGGATVLAACWSLVVLWFQRWGGVVGLLSGVAWVLGGLIAPSPYMPAGLRWAMRCSPFWYDQGGPAEILAGVTAPQWWMWLAAAGWLVGGLALYRRVWRVALRRYEGVGI
jgi:ABC-2 type transport system permease protein